MPSMVLVIDGQDRSRFCLSVDGGTLTVGTDLGKTFIVPGVGTVCLGKSQQRAEIVLHDLSVSRVHCELQPEGDRVLITHVEGAEGTLVNGVRITGQQELRPGDSVRV